MTSVETESDKDKIEKLLQKLQKLSKEHKVQEEIIDSLYKK